MTPIEQIQQIDLTALRKRATSIVDPHFIEWTAPSHPLAINHTDWTVRPHFFGHIEPRNKGLYTRWARARIAFSITCRDMDEFDEVFRGLKAAADALAETLYGKKT